jgi:NAD-dependent dihydropyrimidine dehydrogenase PreA subunit
MLNLDIIQNLIASNDAQPVQVNPARCLNARHKARQCEKCLACPTDAISLISGARVELDARRCVECGLCASVCPAHAFTPNGSSDDAILDAVAEYSNIEFACKRAVETRVPNAERVMTLACLARLSSDLLIAAAAEHANVWLNDSLCAECPLGKRAHPQIVALIDAAKHLLAAWNREQIIKPYTDAELASPRRLTRARASGAEMSRREMFSFFRDHVGRAAGMVVAASLGRARVAKPQAAAETQSLERALMKLGKPLSEYIADTRFATIEVAASCTACRVCAILCPTRAIEYRETEGYFVLAFHARACLGAECGLCQIACQANALKLTPGAARDALESREEHILRAGALTICGKCQTPFATEPGEINCPMCRAAEAKYKMLMKDILNKESNDPSPSGG